MPPPMFVSALTLALLSIASADCMAGECPAQGSGLIQRDVLRTPVAPEEPGYTLAGYINEVLLPRADETHKRLKKALKEQRIVVKGTWDSIIGAKENQTNQDLRSIRLNMRKYSLCQRMVGGEEIKQEEYCEEWHYAAKNFRPKTLDQAKGNLKKYKQILEKYYQFYPGFMKLKNECEVAMAEVSSEGYRCSVHKSTMRDFYCVLRKNLTDMCDEYDDAYGRARKTFDETAGDVHVMAEHTKETYKALKCFAQQSSGLQFVTNVDSNNLNAPASPVSCGNESFDSDFLGIPTAEAPEKQPCSRKPDVPDAGVPHNCSEGGSQYTYFHTDDSAVPEALMQREAQEAAAAEAAEATVRSGAALLQSKPQRANKGAETAAAFATAEEFLRDAEATMEKMREQMRKQ